MKGMLPACGGKRTPLSSSERGANQDWINKPRYFFNLLPQAQTLFKSLMEHPKPKFLSFMSITHKCIVCLKSMKAAHCLLWLLLRSRVLSFLSPTPTPAVFGAFFALLRSLQDLSSLPGDWTQAQHWKHRVLTTGLPGSSLRSHFSETSLYVI